MARPGDSRAALAKPNIILIVTDDQTIDSVAKMPYVSSQRWIKFDNAFVENALCCPSRASILQGRADTRTRVINNATTGDFNESQSIAVWLKQAGYATGLYGKYFNGYPFGKPLYTPPGWTDWHVAYYNVLEQYDWTSNDNGTSNHHGTAPADYAVNVQQKHASRFITANAGHKPFFAMLTPTATHQPWQASPSRAGMYKSATVPHPPNINENDVSDKPAWVRRLPFVDVNTMDVSRRKAWSAAASVDDAIRRLDDTLRATGQYDKTVVIFMSDNGYSFGAHRWPTKMCAYNECAQVPLIVRYPGQGQRVDHSLITNLDIASTILDIADASPGLSQDGRSFLPQLVGAGELSRQGILQHWPGGDGLGVSGTAKSIPQFWAVRTKKWKYVETDGDRVELYDQAADPYELVNKAGLASTAAVQTQLRSLLRDLKSSVAASTTYRPGGPSGEPVTAPDLD